jgi:hypothetical protein
MKPEFREDYIHQHTDPTTEPYADFDWEELYACLGEAEKLDDESMQQFTLLFRRVLQWVLNTNINNKRAAEQVGRRAIAFAWVMNPELFEGKSMTAVAAAIGLHKQTLSKTCAEVTREFGMQNRGQAHGWNRINSDNSKAASLSDEAAQAMV